MGRFQEADTAGDSFQEEDAAVDSFQEAEDAGAQHVAVLAGSYQVGEQGKPLGKDYQ